MGGSFCYEVTDYRKAPTRYCFALRTSDDEPAWHYFCVEKDADFVQWLSYLQVAHAPPDFATAPREVIGAAT